MSFLLLNSSIEFVVVVVVAVVVLVAAAVEEVEECIEAEIAVGTG